MPSPLRLDQFTYSVQLGPTPAQLEFIDGLADWLDLTPDDLIEMAVDIIPQQALESREVESLRDLTIGEASELIEELKSRKRAELDRRRGR